jgi:antitoxin PrlF
MSSSRVSSKGQVTVPADVRKALNIEQGDDLLFEVASDQAARLRVVKRQRRPNLRGALRANRPFPGKKAIREETAQSLAQQPPGKQGIAAGSWGALNLDPETLRDILEIEDDFLNA